MNESENPPNDTTELIKATPSEPALYSTTQNTIPLITSLLFSLDLGLLAIFADYIKDYPGSAWDIKLSMSFLGFSAILLLISTLSCAKSQAWDYFSVDSGYIKAEKIREDDKYKSFCIRNVKEWHFIAIRTYSLGLFFLLFSLYWFVSLFSKKLSYAILAIILIKWLFSTILSGSDFGIGMGRRLHWFLSLKIFKYFP